MPRSDKDDERARPPRNPRVPWLLVVILVGLIVCGATIALTLLGGGLIPVAIVAGLAAFYYTDKLIMRWVKFLG